MSDFESGHDDPEYPKDWRGNDIGAFAKVIYREGDGPFNQIWHLGEVTNVVNDPWYGWRVFVADVARSDGNALQDNSLKPWELMIFREGPN